MNNSKYYKMLNVPTDATPQALKVAYKKQLKRYHPDLNQGDPTAEAKFKAVTEAYALITNPPASDIMELELSLTPEEAITGKVQQLAISGDDDDPDRLIKIKIPAGVKNGSRFRINGGNAFYDIHITIKIQIITQRPNRFWSFIKDLL